jgi:hypothetical protein
MNATITIKAIELLLSRIVLKLKEDGISNFEFKDDEYWIILTEEWTEFNQTPKPAVGSLVDDTEFLKSVLENNELITYLELERLSAVLRAISSQLVK